MIELNKFYLSDNLEFLNTIPDNFIDLIYIDPPFFTQKDWVKFVDEWNSIDDYLWFMELRIKEIYRILKNTGSFYLHCDLNAGFELKILCDKIFGRDNFKREIIWNVGSVSGFKARAKNWIRQHDIILYYTKSKEFTFNKQYLPYSKKYTLKFSRQNSDGRKYRIRGQRKQYLNEMKGIPIGTVWNDIYSYQTRTKSKEYLGYPTQKPEKLLERIIVTSSNKGDIVADFFCGSGTTCVMAEKLNRKWLGVDSNAEAISMSNKRLDGLQLLNEIENNTKSLF